MQNAEKFITLQRQQYHLNYALYHTPWNTCRATHPKYLTPMKRFVYFIGVMTLVMSACTQLETTYDEAAVKQSIEPSLVVVCSKYGFPDRSGNDHRAEYGYCYTLGVFTDTGFVVPASALNETDFSRCGVNSYFCGLSYRRITDSLYRTLPPCADILTDELLHLTPEPASNAPSLAEYTDTVFENSLLLWAFVSDSMGKMGSVYTMVTELSVELNGADLTQRVVAPPLPETLHDELKSCKTIGAVWVVPCHTQNDGTQYRVAGMAVRDSDGWLLVKL